MWEDAGRNNLRQGAVGRPRHLLPGVPQLRELLEWAARKRRLLLADKRQGRECTPCHGAVRVLLAVKTAVFVLYLKKLFQAAFRELQRKADAGILSSNLHLVVPLP